MFYYTNFNPFDPPKPSGPAKPPDPPKPPGEPKAPAQPRVAVLVGGGKEALVALPPTYDKAIEVATDKFEVPKKEYVVRLAVKKVDVPNWMARFTDGDLVFIADDPSYQLVCAGRQVVRLDVVVYARTEPLPSAAAPPAKGSTCPIEIICENAAGKGFRLQAKATADMDLSKDTPVGDYYGVLTIKANPTQMFFLGREQPGGGNGSKGTK